MHSYKSYTRCSYINCNKTSQDISLFRFPVLDQERLELWIRNTGNTFLDSLTNKELKHRYICAAHFPLSYIHCKNQRNRVLKDAVPIHFLCEAKDLDSVEIESMCKLLDQITSPHWEKMVLTPHSMTVSYARCAFHGCGRGGQGVPMFRFPVHDKDRLVQWVRNSGNVELETMSKDELRQRYVCAMHFPASSVHESEQRSRLLGSAVPAPSQEAIRRKHDELDKSNLRSRKPSRVDPHELAQEVPAKRARFLASGLCFCCREREPDRALWPASGVDEEYGRLLQDCFKIDLSSAPEARMCSICVSQLRAAAGFQQQVVRGARRLLAGLDVLVGAKDWTGAVQQLDAGQQRATRSSRLPDHAAVLPGVAQGSKVKSVKKVVVPVRPSPSDLQKPCKSNKPKPKLKSLATHDESVGTINRYTEVKTPVKAEVLDKADLKVKTEPPEQDDDETSTEVPLNQVADLKVKTEPPQQDDDETSTEVPLSQETWVKVKIEPEEEEIESPEARDSGQSTNDSLYIDYNIKMCPDFSLK